MEIEYEDTKVPKVRHWVSIVVMTAIIVLIGAIGILGMLLIYPYAPLELKAVEETEQGFAKITTDTDEYLNDYPIVDDDLFVDVYACNPGYNTRVERWFDTVSNQLPGGLVLDNAEEDAVVTASLGQIQQFYVNERLCGPEEVASIPVGVPNNLTTGQIYRLRFVYSYKPNSIRTDETILVTEPFIYRGGA